MELNWREVFGSDCVDGGSAAGVVEGVEGVAGGRWTVDGGAPNPGSRQRQRQSASASASVVKRKQRL